VLGIVLNSAQSDQRRATYYDGTEPVYAISGRQRRSLGSGWPAAMSRQLSTTFAWITPTGNDIATQHRARPNGWFAVLRSGPGPAEPAPPKSLAGQLGRRPVKRWASSLPRAYSGGGVTAACNSGEYAGSGYLAGADLPPSTPPMDCGPQLILAAAFGMAHSGEATLLIGRAGVSASHSTHGKRGAAILADAILHMLGPD